MSTTEPPASASGGEFTEKEVLHPMSHSKKNRALRCVLPCLLAGTLLLSSVPVLAVNDGVEPTYDEAYYAMTDYYGNLTEGSVVKSYTVNGASSLTDYGDYDEIVNLTDDRVPTSAAGGNVFFFDGDAPEHFYFEGKTAQPFEDLPWTLSVHYTLNGVAAKAEDLAGKTGVVEIQIDAIPNENASEYAKRNYTLEAMAIFNQDDILSLEAPGAQVQLIGNLRAVLFLGLPGEECHYTIRVGSNAFSFGGMTFLMVPATLSQLQEIATLSQRKDDLEENYEKLSQGIDALLDSLGGISSGLYSAANGLDQLNAARETLSQNSGTLSWQADAVLGDLNALNSSLATLPGHLDRGKKLLSDTEKDVKALNAALTEARDELEDIQVDVKALKTDLARIGAASSASASDLEALGKKADTLGKHLDKLSAILQAIELRLRGEGVDVDGMTLPQLQDALEQARMLDRIFRSVGSGEDLDFQEFAVAVLMVQAAQKGQELTAEDAAAQAQALSDARDAVNALVPQVMAQYEKDGVTLTEDEAAAIALQQLEAKQPGITRTYETARELDRIYTSLAGDGFLNEKQFFAAVLYLQTKDMAKALAQSEILWKLLTGADNLVSNAQELCDLLGYEKGLSGDVAALLRGVSSAIDDLERITVQTKDLRESLTDVLDSVDTIRDRAEKEVPKLQSALTDLKSVTVSLNTTLSDSTAFLGSFRSVLKTAGKQADSGARETLDGLAAALRSTAGSLSKTGQVKDAKDNISGLIEDTWNEFTGENNNLLLMDATAEAESLTDSRNGAPQSVQVLIRTQEIKETEAEQPEEEQPETESLTLWQRIGKLFQSIGSAIAGIFGK